MIQNPDDQRLQSGGAGGAAVLDRTPETPAWAERCPRCDDASAVREIIVDASVEGEGAPPLFECAACRFEWGEVVGERMG